MAPTIRLELEWRPLWKVDIPMLSPGTYRYKFVLDGGIWVHDPENLHRESDGYRGLNSVFTIAEAGSGKVDCDTKVMSS
jgi:hypothetical protein